MVSLLSRSVHKFRAGVAIRKDTWRGKATAGNDSFQHELSLLLYDEKLSPIETHDPEIPQELYRLARELGEMEH